jgi:hypothetical protein
MLPQPIVDQVTALLLNEGRRYIDENLAETDLANKKPFHARLMTGPFAGWSKLSERSFSTRSGNWFQTIARLVASASHPVAENRFKVAGTIRPAAEAHIEAILDAMDRPQPRRIPSRAMDIAEVLTVSGVDGVPRATTSDLYVRTASGEELYFEIKTPQPNKGQAHAMKKQILLISALRFGHEVNAYGATAYNPDGDGQPYTWNYTPQFLEIGRDFLVGRQFWARIGEPSTYDELLEIAERTGVELNAHLERRLGL